MLTNLLKIYPIKRPISTSLSPFLNLSIICPLTGLPTISRFRSYPTPYEDKHE
jgi:hypothetical protein